MLERKKVCALGAAEQTCKVPTVPAPVHRVKIRRKRAVAGSARSLPVLLRCHLHSLLRADPQPVLSPVPLPFYILTFGLLGQPPP